MRKIYLLVTLLACQLITSATVYTVSVTSNQFSPANIPNVQVGDIVRFSFESGFHNASSLGVSGGVPVGAADLYSGDPAAESRIYDYNVTTAGTYKYICDVHGDASSFTGMVGTFTASAAVPATLKEFKIATDNNKHALLSWKTVSELNVAYFSVRMSTNGFTYDEVARVTASGNSAAENSYTFTHTKVPAKFKYVYYVLATVDKDGKEKISEVRSFKNLLTTAELVTSVSPNPISRPGQLMIQFNADKTSELVAKVYDANGRLAAETKMSAFPGLNNGHIHVCNLSAGTYTIKFNLDGITQSKKILVQ